MIADPFLAHFACYAFEPALWILPDRERVATGAALKAALRGAGEAVHLYGTYATRSEADLLVWTSVPVTSTDAAAAFFGRLEAALRPFRAYLRLVEVLWGFTRESQYARGGSERRMDPAGPRTLPYLVVYPFSKTHPWYRLEPEERQRMMSEHIRIGHTYEEVRQLLLYSAGLQDHEFVVVYETPDLAAFSALVRELRATQVRAYTALDAPVRVGVHLPEGDGAWP